MEERLDAFRAADTQVLGVSIDSVYCHANWARDLGGISFPLLSDFQPKGAAADSFGRYLADIGIDDRSTVIIDKEGIVRHSSTVTPSGQRDMDELVAECQRIAGEPVAAEAPGKPLPAGTELFVKTACGASRSVLVALGNLHIEDAVQVNNVSEDESAAARLAQVGGSNQAPCLVMDGIVTHEGAEIIRKLADHVAPMRC